MCPCSARCWASVARLHAYDIADELDATTPADYVARAEMRARFGYAAQQVLEALNILINVHGAAGFAETGRLPQFWRDANTAARHAALNSVVGYEIYGKALLDVEERISPMV
ncbi:acyl-CoA dehydrogenase family protein [Amycolatopsis carbonis]|uniref:Acyl-CoA dehydrogenase family protein n=1 Tax=Amycolatopsis carbonis TaxID=715471 RepID=A0A9Y2IP35_9PSEU|nr:acyl-CoA dehydrogenase family protein [Amycolatopsis sp. 2-15]WIX83915.1 acyl-CoA dehydrogenase family protein [Amycolatopsis sp. 2-15]